MANSSDLNVALFSYYGWYIFSEDVAAAQWVRVYGAVGQLVCADFNSGYRVLTSYGGNGRDGPMANGQWPMLPSGCDFTHQYVYLSISNSLLQVGTTTEGNGYGGFGGREGVFPLNLTSPTLFAENRIYSDGASVFANP
jgi:hypothetical protein